MSEEGLQAMMKDAYVLLRNAIQTGSSLHTPLARLRTALPPEFIAQYPPSDQDTWQERLKELEQLRAWKERAMPIVQAMTARSFPGADDGVCPFCEKGILHKPDCPVVAARALLAEGETQGDGR